MIDIENLNRYNPPRELLNGKTILVTGASDGIGRCAAITYAQFGANVILLGKTESKLERVYDQIVANGDAEPFLATFDLNHSDESHYSALAEQIETSSGHLDGLLHNAGILGELKPLSQYPADKFQQVMNVNTMSNFLLTKAMLPALNRAESASIIFTSSSVGRTGRAYWGAYAISKFAVEGMMQILAEEIANTSNIRCNSLNPCATGTAMRRQAYPAESQEANPSPEDIMGAYLFLMGDESRAINGRQLDARKR